MDVQYQLTLLLHLNLRESQSCFKIGRF